MSPLAWFGKNKLIVLLSFLVLFFIFILYLVNLNSRLNNSYVSSTPGVGGLPQENFQPKPFLGERSAGLAAVDQTANQVIIQESYLSLQVKDVRGSSDKIISYAKDKDGLFVSSSFNQPEESPFATVSVRVPIANLDESLTYFRSLGVKVVSENLQGVDVTDEFGDIQSRLDLLERTKSKLESLLDQATRVEDILNIQRELDYVLEQIDSLTNQKMQMEKGASLTKITIYLSTDELALPYAPDKSFRPALIFKQAVRSLVVSARGLAGLAIWLGVYAVVWLPVLAVLIWLAKRKRIN